MSQPPTYNVPGPGQMDEKAAMNMAAPQPQVYHTFTPVAALGPGAAPADCPACRTRTITRITHVAGCMTHLWATIACLAIGLPCIPYCIDSVKDVDHRCGNCGVLLATFKRNGGTIVHLHG